MFDYPYLETPALRDSQHQIYQMPPDLENWVQIQLEMRRQKIQADLSEPTKANKSRAEAEDSEQENASDLAEKTVEVYLTERSFNKKPVFVLGYQQEAKHYLLECCYFHIVAPEKQRKGQAQGMELVLDRIPLERVFDRKP